MTDLASNATAGESARAARRAALENLGEAELLALAYDAPVGLFAAVVPFGNVLVNKRMCEITGRRNRDLLGDLWFDAVHADDRTRIEGLVRDAMDGDGSVDTEHRVVRPDGETRWVRMKMACVHHDPPPTTFVGSMSDITELKHVEAALRESEGRFRAIVEQGFDIVVVLDADLRVSYVSPAARRLGGYHDAGIGKPARDFIHTDDVAGTLAFYRAILNDEPVPAMHPVRVITADGRLEALELVARKLDDERRRDRRGGAHRHRPRRGRGRAARFGGASRATRRRSSR